MWQIRMPLASRTEQDFGIRPLTDSTLPETDYEVVALSGASNWRAIRSWDYCSCHRRRQESTSPAAGWTPTIPRDLLDIFLVTVRRGRVFPTLVVAGWEAFDGGA